VIWGIAWPVEDCLASFTSFISLGGVASRSEGALNCGPTFERVGAEDERALAVEYRERPEPMVPAQALADDLDRLLEDSHVAPEALTLEITESVIIDGLRLDPQMFDPVKALGVGLLGQQRGGLAGGRGGSARHRGAGRQAVRSDRLSHGGHSAGVPPPELPGAALYT